ncbi:NF-kappa-B inhibitor cactus-like [Microplitis mediator]|uniref:NF-kappa-B inhibitor cactus-like n=1 Tax=Microplitis mediator TaxID=375433 RepID=UPI002552BB76|nr:NF-kappa-B inhibitor cactus-like [Microplitis mediator]
MAGQCSTKSQSWCVETAEHEENKFMMICRKGNVYELMELAPFISNDGHLLRNYDHRGRQCIHTVALYDRKNAIMKIEILVNMGADINAKERNTGNSLLHIAVRTKNYQLAEWLCQEPTVNLGAINYAHHTAYHMAYYAHDEKMKELLIANRAVCDDPEGIEMSEDDIGDFSSDG